MTPENIAIAGKEGTVYKMLDSQEKQAIVDDWTKNRQDQNVPEMDKYELLGDPKIVSYFCAAAIAHPDTERRPLYATKLTDYINKVEAASAFDTLNWVL